MRYLITPELLHKYVDGKCTENEILLIHQWYDSFEDEEDLFDTLSEDEQQALELAMLNNFKISTAPIFTENKKKDNIVIRLTYVLTGMAAMLLLVWALYLNYKPSILNNQDAVITTAAQQMEVNNQTNSIYKQVLADGSIVWLSPKSELRYPKRFTGNYREVKMSGEAFFEVKKDHAHPFIIYSGGVITRVWGTSFRIRAYNNVPTEVSVLTGKVSVKLPEKERSEVMLLPKQKAVYQTSSTTLTSGAETNPAALAIWHKTSVNFDDMPLNDVLTVLSKQFASHIYTNDNELKKYLFKADFTDQNLPAILDMLESSLNVAYTINHNEIELYRKYKTN